MYITREYRTDATEYQQWAAAHALSAEQHLCMALSYRRRTRENGIGWAAAEHHKTEAVLYQTKAAIAARGARHCMGLHADLDRETHDYYPHPDDFPVFLPYWEYDVGSAEYVVMLLMTDYSAIEGRMLARLNEEGVSVKDYLISPWPLDQGIIQEEANGMYIGLDRGSKRGEDWER